MDIVFKGNEADEHEIEAYSGAVSLEGISRAASLAAHYAATGEVRFRAPYTEEIEFRLSAPQDGSLAFPFKAVSKIAKGLAKKRFASALFLALLARSTGQEIPPDVAEEISNVNSGDLDAMAEGATAGLWRAHRWIDNDEKMIQINGARFTNVVLNGETKEYLEFEEVERASQDVTVAAVNANSKTGRAFFEDLGRTIPFKVAKEAAPRNLSNLSRYLNEYIDRNVRRNNEWVSIKFLPIRYSDGRLKKIIILDCALASELK